MSGAYYNEIDGAAAAWLRELIKAGAIADGEVDTRSIVDVRPDDLRGFRQCHFFAGIGGWSLALRLAGWPDDRPVWTGSCPCQPFSVAGKGEGTSDPRHLWPTWFPLIRECRPPTVFGEQVASADGEYWLDLVCDAMEGIEYAIGALDLPAASVGSPQRRPRFWFVADDDRARRAQLGLHRLRKDGDAHAGADTHGRGAARGVADTAGERRHRRRASKAGAGSTAQSERLRDARELGDAGGARLQGLAGHGDDGDQPGWFGADPSRPTPAAGPTSGFWSPCEWIPCTDGTARPIEPGTFPLAHGVPARVGRLRGYGNAIVPQVAAEVIAAYMEVRG